VNKLAPEPVSHCFPARRIAIAIAAAVFLLAPTAHASCAAVVLFDGRTYYGVGGASGPVEIGAVAGTGEIPGCDDTVEFQDGELVEESPPEPTPVTVYAVRGASVEERIAIELGDAKALFSVGAPLASSEEAEGPGSSHALELVFAVLAIALGTTLVLLRERLGAQARAQGHGVAPFGYLVIGVILVASGAYAASRALG